MSQNVVRVRFAPSPTGNMHIGGLRTALFNWLFARHNNGVFLVRIEDTDKERSEEKYVHSLLAALAWVGIESDEEIVFQSQRQEAYHNVLEKLLAEKKAYRCYCVDQELEQRVRAKGISDEHYGYDGFCKEKPFDPTDSRPYGIRFAVPNDIQAIEINDLIRGTVVFERSQLDDFIIFRSDGTPMYNYAVVVDDNYSGITHVIRGEEHLSNSPKQLLLYQACGFKAPQFAHIPMILAPDGTKLSKRHGAVDVLCYQQDGYLPNALVNYIVRLGWSAGDQELFNRNEMIAQFGLDGIGKKAAIFDIQKLEWMNGVYLREAKKEELLEAIQESSVAAEFAHFATLHSHEQILEAIRLYQSRVSTVVKLAQEVMKLFTKPAVYAEQDIAQWITPQTRLVLAKIRALLAGCEPFDVITVTQELKALCTEEDLKLPAVAQPLRIALTGGTSSPGVFELIVVLGKTTVLERLRLFENYRNQ